MHLLGGGVGRGCVGVRRFLQQPAADRRLARNVASCAERVILSFPSVLSHTRSMRVLHKPETQRGMSVNRSRGLKAPLPSWKQVS